MTTHIPSAPDAGARHPSARQVFTLAWPMTLKAIMLHGTVVVDAYLVAGLGEAALAAMGLAAAIAGFVLGAILAFSNAMQIRTAQAAGSGDPAYLKSALAAGLSISLTVGVVGLAAILLFGGQIVTAMAPTAEVADLARRYLSIFSLVIMGEAVGQCLSSYFNGCGRTRLPLYSFCLSLPINVVASVVLIYGAFGVPGHGVAGAAMGSAIAVAVQVLFLAVSLLRSERNVLHEPGWRHARFATTLKRHFLFSLPIAATFFSATFATHVCTLVYAELSLSAFAAMTLIAPWIMVTGTVGMQWAQAAGIIMAQLLGQRQPVAVLDAFLSSAWRGAFVASGIVALLLAGVCLSADLLYQDLSAETRATLMAFLPVLLLLPFPKGSNAICGNTLRASGDTVYVMHIFVWSQWLFRVPATVIAVLWLDVHAAWVLSLLLIEELLKFPAFHRRLFKGDWKRRPPTD